MTSIITNISANAALQTLRTINSDLAKTHERVGSGLRVGAASDDAGYWSISTTMRSDKMALTAVSDALGLGAATADTTYAGLNAVIDILATFKARLISATQAGTDRTKIQEELEQLKQQVLTVAQSASFSGENWLNTDIPDIYDNDINTASILSGFVRANSGQIAVQHMDIHLSEVALFNSTGGGLLQADKRDLETIGGMRFFRSDEVVYSGSGTEYHGEIGSGWMYPEQTRGTAGNFFLSFPVDSSLDFNAPGAEIKFDIILDKEASNPHNKSGTLAELDQLPGPYFPGISTQVSITRADVDAYDPSLGGIISTNTQFAAVLNTKLNSLGAYVSANYIHLDPPGSENWVHDPEAMNIRTLQQNGDGSYVEIANLQSVDVSLGGLREASAFGTRGSGIELNFEDFIVYEDGDNEQGVEISFTFSLNGGPPTVHSFNRTYVNDVLGKQSGKVATAEEMATLLNSLIAADWPGLIIEATSSSTVMIKSDPALDRKWGGGTSIEFDDIRVSIEPLPIIDFLDVDVDQHPELINSYIEYLDVVAARVVDGASLVGALQKRIAIQSNFTDQLAASIDKGIGQLVDADMNEEATRLRALQTQEQLAIRSLSIANHNADAIMQLFR